MVLSMLESFSFTFLVVLDGATNLVMAYPVNGTDEPETQEVFREFLHHMQIYPKYVFADSMFMTPKLETFYITHGIAAKPVGPMTPWPNRAEAAVRIFKQHVFELCEDLKDNPIRKVLFVRTLLREA